MYICICNKITEKDIEKNPLLKQVVGTYCGMCISDGEDSGFDGVNEDLTDNSIDTVSIK